MKNQVKLKVFVVKLKCRIATMLHNQKSLKWSIKEWARSYLLLFIFFWTPNFTRISLLILMIHRASLILPCIFYSKYIIWISSISPNNMIWTSIDVALSEWDKQLYCKWYNLSTTNRLKEKKTQATCIRYAGLRRIIRREILAL